MWLEATVLDSAVLEANHVTSLSLYFLPCKIG